MKYLHLSKIAEYIIDSKLARLASRFKIVFIPKRFDYDYAISKLNYLKRKHPRKDGQIVYKSGRTKKALLGATYTVKNGKIKFSANVPNYIKYTCFRIRQKKDLVSKLLDIFTTIPAEFGEFYKMLKAVMPEMNFTVAYAKKLHNILKQKKKKLYWYRPFSIYSEIKRIKSFEIVYLLKTK